MRPSGSQSLFSRSPVAEIPDISGILSQSKNQGDLLMSEALARFQRVGGRAEEAPVQGQSMSDGLAALGQQTWNSDSSADPELVNYYRNGLIQRGMPAHVAEGFVWNLIDESGLRTDINEIAPVVPGSRGGFGVAQWTGPRRVALEDFARSQNAKLIDRDLQLDFIMHENNTTERAAYQRALQTQTASEAAASFVRNWFRPLPEYQERRASRYLARGL